MPKQKLDNEEPLSINLKIDKTVGFPIKKQGFDELKEGYIGETTKLLNDNAGFIETKVTSMKQRHDRR